MQIASSHAAAWTPPPIRRPHTPARGAEACHLALVPDKNTMLYWLAQVCRAERVDRKPKVKALDVASRIRDHMPNGESVDNATISRFEKGTIWPRTPTDAIVAAYADELRVEPIELWTEALRLWHTHLAGEALSAEGEAAAVKPQRADAAKRASGGPGRRRAG